MGVFSHAERKCGIFEVERVDYGCVSAIITAEAKGGSGIAQTTNDGERMMNVNDVTFNDGETKMNEQTEQTEQAEQTEQTEQAQIVDKPHAIAPQPSKSTKTTWKMVYLDSEGNVLKETPRGRGRPPYAAEADEVNKTITIPNCHVNASGEIVTPKAPRPTGNTGNTGQGGNGGNGGEGGDILTGDATIGVVSAGFANTPFPAASAAAICPVKIASGKFHGEIQVTTPAGRSVGTSMARVA